MFFLDHFYVWLFSYERVCFLRSLAISSGSVIEKKVALCRIVVLSSFAMLTLLVFLTSFFTNILPSPPNQIFSHKQSLVMKQIRIVCCDPSTIRSGLLYRSPPLHIPILLFYNLDHETDDWLLLHLVPRSAVILSATPLPNRVFFSARRSRACGSSKTPRVIWRGNFSSKVNLARNFFSLKEGENMR